MFIPVVGLASFHIGLVCMGRTTNEHVRGTSVMYDQQILGQCVMKVPCVYIQAAYNNKSIMVIRELVLLCAV